jgi:hypothetical protein
VNGLQKFRLSSAHKGHIEMVGRESRRWVNKESLQSDRVEVRDHWEKYACAGE